MQVRNRMSCRMYFRYAGRSSGSHLAPEELSGYVDPARFSDRVLQRDWRLRRIDLVLSADDRATMGAATCAEIDAFQEANGGPPLRLDATGAKPASTRPGIRTSPPPRPRPLIVPPRQRKTAEQAAADVAAAQAARPTERVTATQQRPADRVIVDIVASPGVRPVDIASKLPPGRAVSLADLQAANSANK